MTSLQPRNKSFGFYVRYGYILAGGKPSLEQDELFTQISLIDDSVLILDDIFDNSSTRNGKPCLHKSHGIQYANITAQKMIPFTDEMVEEIAAKFAPNQESSEIAPVLETSVLFPEINDPDFDSYFKKTESDPMERLTNAYISRRELMENTTSNLLPHFLSLVMSST